jgi:nucleotidyltransferase substrate binding protein (TIGR01987 family)
MSSRLRQRLDGFGRALDRLDEALAVPADAPLALDGTIQRFEFAFELAWKTLKDALLEEGVETRTPRETLREAYRVGWLDTETAWLQMLRDRNISSHVYSEEVAAEIYGRVRDNAAVLRKAHTAVSQNAQD